MTGHRHTVDIQGRLTVREVTQALREITFGRHAMVRADTQGTPQGTPGLLLIEVEGWRISLMHTGAALCHCTGAISPDGRQWTLASGDRYDPMALLSTWELATLQGLLQL
ncbi:DUF7693 family protein [Pseudomonas sp. TE3610]